MSPEIRAVDDAALNIRQFGVDIANKANELSEAIELMKAELEVLQANLPQSGPKDGGIAWNAYCSVRADFHEVRKFPRMRFDNFGTVVVRVGMEAVAALVKSYRKEEV